MVVAVTPRAEPPPAPPAARVAPPGPTPPFPAALFPPAAPPVAPAPSRQRPQRRRQRRRCLRGPYGVGEPPGRPSRGRRQRYLLAPREYVDLLVVGQRGRRRCRRLPGLQATRLLGRLAVGPGEPRDADRRVGDGAVERRGVGLIGYAVEGVGDDMVQP